MKVSAQKAASRQNLATADHFQVHVCGRLFVHPPGKAAISVSKLRMFSHLPVLLPSHEEKILCL